VIINTLKRTREILCKRRLKETKQIIEENYIQENKIMLLPTEATMLVVIVTLEITIIVMGNVFTIFVFWTQRLRLKRTFLLLINLAVADSFVGLGKALLLATNTILS